MYRKALISPLVLKVWDDSIFEYFRTPSGVDREITIDNILLKTAEMTTIYTNPEVFKQMVKIWVNKRFGIWQKLYDTTQFEYNPIHNYDREEEYTENTETDNNTVFHSDKIDNFNRNLSENYERNLSESYERNLSDTENKSGNNSNTYSDKREKQLAAFNNGLTDSEKENTSGNGSGEFEDNATKTATGTTKNNQTGTTVNNQTGTTNGSENYNKNESNTETVDNSHKLHAFGNIGVTTTQQMIQQERDIVQFDIIDYITDDFITNFCIMIY